MLGFGSSEVNADAPLQRNSLDGVFPVRVIDSVARFGTCLHGVGEALLIRFFRFNSFFFKFE